MYRHRLVGVVLQATYQLQIVELEQRNLGRGESSQYTGDMSFEFSQLQMSEWRRATPQGVGNHPQQIAREIREIIFRVGEGDGPKVGGSYQQSAQREPGSK